MTEDAVVLVAEDDEDIRALVVYRLEKAGYPVWRHAAVIGNPRYGVIGLVAFPYFLAIEFLGAAMALLGVPLVVVLWVLGHLSWLFFVSFLVVAFLLGTLLSTAALALEEFNFRRHPRRREVLRLVGYAVVENFGYRQLNDVWRTIGYVDLLRRRTGWGVQQRRGFGGVPTSGAR